MPPKCIYDGETYIDEIIIFESICISNNGTWIESVQECEYVSKEFCDSQDGVFNECGLACRNNQSAETCTMQCVPFCKFNP